MICVKRFSPEIRVRYEVPYDLGVLGSKDAELNSDHDGVFQNS